VSQNVVYRCSPSVVWVKDAEQILVVDGETQRSWALRDAGAVTWELLVVGYPYRRLVAMLSLILSLPAQEAERMLVDILQQWHDGGIVCESREADGG
jgi:hypothetical protein